MIESYIVRSEPWKGHKADYGQIILCGSEKQI